MFRSLRDNWVKFRSFLPLPFKWIHTHKFDSMYNICHFSNIHPAETKALVRKNKSKFVRKYIVRQTWTNIVYKIAKRGGELGRNPIMIKRWLPAHPWNKNHRLERICFLWTRRRWVVVVVIPPSSSPLTASPFEWNRQRDEKPSARLSKARSRFHKKGGDYVIMRMLSRDSRYRPASKHSLFEPLPRINPIPPHFRKFAPTSSTSVSPSFKDGKLGRSDR